MKGWSSDQRCFTSGNLLDTQWSHLEKDERYQRNKKHKKYSRDVGDYKTGVVFGWQKLSPSMFTSEFRPTVSGITGGQTAIVVTSNDRPSQGPGGARPNRRDSSSHEHRWHPSFLTPNRGTYRNRRGGRGHHRGNYRYPTTSYGQGLGGQHLRQSTTWYHEYPVSHNSNSYYSNRPPVTTYNRYSPLREPSSGDQYSYIEGDYGGFDHSHFPF